jgi:hypothetical protein
VPDGIEVAKIYARENADDALEPSQSMMLLVGECLLELQYGITNGSNVARAFPNGKSLAVWPDVSTHSRQAEMFAAAKCASHYLPWRGFIDGCTIER